MGEVLECREKRTPRAPPEPAGARERARLAVQHTIRTGYARSAPRFLGWIYVRSWLAAASETRPTRGRTHVALTRSSKRAVPRAELAAHGHNRRFGLALGGRLAHRELTLGERLPALF